MSGLTLADQSADPDELLGWFQRMRAEHPVVRDEQAGVWLVFGYEDTARVLGDHAVFSSDFSAITAAQQDVDLFIRGNFLRKDPPQHRKLRTLAGTAFTPRMVAALEPRITQICGELLDEMGRAEEIEFVSQFAAPLPVTVIAELLGIPRADRERFRGWADALVAPESQTSFIPNEQRMRSMAAVMREMNTYCLEHIRDRRAHPGPDLTSKLIEAEVDGQRLEDEEIVGFVDLLLLAGHVTTTVLLGNAVLSLHENPDAAAALRNEPGRLPGAIEEVLRMRAPLAPTLRRTSQQVCLGGQDIPAGQMVLTWLASANRDERQFAEPDRFVVDRQPNAHLSFGHGIHFCLGAPLARLEARIALELLLTRWTELCALPGMEFHDPRGIFGVKRLPLRVRWA